MKITSKEASKLVKDYACFKFSKGAYLVLQNMARSTYRKVAVADVATMLLTVRPQTLGTWAQVRSDRQMRRIVDELTESGVVTITERKARKIHYTLNLGLLADGQPSADTTKQAEADKRKDRASKARNTYAAQRKATRLTDAARTMRENRYRFFDTVLHSGTQRKHSYPAPCAIAVAL